MEIFYQITVEIYDKRTQDCIESKVHNIYDEKYAEKLVAKLINRKLDQPYEIGKYMKINYKKIYRDNGIEQCDNLLDTINDGRLLNANEVIVSIAPLKNGDYRVEGIRFPSRYEWTSDLNLHSEDDYKKPFDILIKDAKKLASLFKTGERKFNRITVGKELIKEFLKQNRIKL